jgi:hypothetical protein
MAHKLLRGVFEVKELESVVSFSNFFLFQFLRQKTRFLQKKIFIRVDRRVFGVEESESGATFNHLLYD